MRAEIKEENPVLLDVLGVSRDMPRLGHAAVQYSYLPTMDLRQIYFSLEHGVGCGHRRHAA